MIIPGSKYSLRLIDLPNHQLMVTRLKINLRKVLSILKLIKDISNAYKGILILHGHLIQLAVVYALSKGTYPSYTQIESEYPKEKYQANKTLIQRIFQLLLKFFKLSWSHFIRRDRNRMNVRKKISSKINFCSRRNTRKIIREHLEGIHKSLGQSIKKDLRIYNP